MDYLRSNLKALIEKANTNPTQLSRATGVPQPTIKRILDGTSAEARSRTIAPIAAHFNISVEDLKNLDLAKDDPNRPDTASLRKNIYGEPIPGDEVFDTKLDAISFTKQVNNSFRETIDKNFAHNIDSTFEINGLRFSMDYCSDNIAAEFKAYLPGLSRPSIRSSTSPSIAYYSLWRLSTLRLSTLDSHPHRKYFMFISVINPDGVAAPMGMISRMIAEAGLHKITLVLSSSQGAANFINSYEKGNVTSFNGLGGSDPDESSFL
jgi:DNA-binding Xre family transcriptional regulator